MSTISPSVHPIPDFTGKTQLYHWAKRLCARARHLWPKKVREGNAAEHMGIMLPATLQRHFIAKNANNKWKILPDGTVCAWNDPSLVIWNIYNPFPE